MSAMRFRYRRGMNNYGGYRGKERLNRDRSRASRCQARQLIEEYVEADEDASCRVRIGHRSEFVPSVAEMDTDEEVMAREEQLSLPLAPNPRNQGVDEIEEREVEPMLRLHAPEPVATVVAASIEEQADAGAAEGKRDLSAIEKPKRPAYEWFADRRPARPKSFQRGHFLYGCVVGTAAAAAILAMLRVAFM